MYLILKSVCNNLQTEQRLKLELTFVDSKIKYLKDQLAELNCDWTLFKMKSAASKSPSKPAKRTPLTSIAQSPNLNGTSFSTRNLRPTSRSPTSLKTPLHGLTVWPTSNEDNLLCEFIPSTASSHMNSFSPSSSSSSALTMTPTETPQPSKSKWQCQQLSDTLMRSISAHKFDEDHEKSADLMIYLNLKETSNNLDFTNGFASFIWSHYREDPNIYMDKIRQFNYFREVSLNFINKM